MEPIVTQSIAFAAATLARLRATVAWTVRTAPELGQSMVEYAIIAALVAVVALGAVQLLGRGVCSTFNNVTSAVDSANGGSGGGGGNQCR